MSHSRSVLREYFEALLIAGIFLGFTNTFLVKTFYIPSGSMEDTLLIGDHLFVNRFIYGLSASEDEGDDSSLLPSRALRRGDIVIFRSPETPATDLVKRCIGTPGDTIEIIDKALYINGEAVDDDAYVLHRDEKVFPNRRYLGKQIRQRDNFGPATIPDGEYFFMGDNRDFSYDSRVWGTVPRHYVKGRAVMIYWSFGGKTPDGQWRGWGEKLQQLLGTAGGFFSASRWDRSFDLIR